MNDDLERGETMRRFESVLSKLLSVGKTELDDALAKEKQAVEELADSAMPQDEEPEPDS